MKLLVISAAFPPMKAAEADYAFRLCEALAARQLELHVITTDTRSGSNPLSATVYPLLGTCAWGDLPPLTRFIRRLHPDAILLLYLGWVYKFHPMITFLPTITKARFPSVRFVTVLTAPYGSQPHHTSFGARVLRRAMAKWSGDKDVDYSFGTLLRDSDRLIVLSEEHRVLLSEQFTQVRDKFIVVPPPPLLRMSAVRDGNAREHGRKLLGLQADETLLIYFGRIYPGKGIETLLSAFQAITARRKNIRLLLVGGVSESINTYRPKYPDELHQLTERLGIKDNVSWTGEFPSDSEEPSLYLRAADICILPYDNGVHLNNSSFSNVVAHGVPVITTQGSILEPPFVHGENVYLCPPQNPGALAASIECVLNQPNLRNRLSAGALTLHYKHFSWGMALETIVETVGGSQDSTRETVSGS